MANLYSPSLPFNNYLGFLFFQHSIQMWHDPIFKQTIVVVGHKKISNPIDAFVSQYASFEMKVTDVCWSETFDQVFFHTTCCGDDAVHQPMLNQKPYRVSNSGRYHVGSESQEDCTTWPASDEVIILQWVFLLIAQRNVPAFQLNMVNRMAHKSVLLKIIK